MDMLVPLEGRVAAGLHLEIAELAGLVRVLEQDLARDRLEGGAAFLLVGHVRNAGPAEILLERAEQLALFRISHVPSPWPRTRRSFR